VPTLRIVPRNCLIKYKDNFTFYPGLAADLSGVAQLLANCEGTGRKGSDAH
jgi:hypothetical protein